ncbi:hypothetical protein M0G74_07990 [Microbulbifer sp. CAU 1566]|uniref:hypothetical protein n=1 Tax=Microbulbifer sp. CAU 1566 TaxID=2933269 RepID=UPI0020055F61|nr:hypothetical protein [Microbulbifer sp. CAU 1566]MCK7597213.1 hypothetical protein [Microbulbifer sp. CAU 1566]
MTISIPSQFLSDTDLMLLHEALSLPEDLHSEDHRRAIQKDANEPDALGLLAAAKSLSEGLAVPEWLSISTERLLEDYHSITSAN